MDGDTRGWTGRQVARESSGLHVGHPPYEKRINGAKGPSEGPSGVKHNLGFGLSGCLTK